MKNIIIIFILICICCLSSIIGGILYYNKLQNDISIYNDNIDFFNKKYNMNYYPPEDKIWKIKDFDDIYTTYAAILSVNTTNINVNNKNIILYFGKIKYPIGDFYGGKMENITIVDDVIQNGIHNNTVLPTQKTKYIMSDKTYDVTTPFISTKPVQTGDNLKVFYDPQKKVAPPFIDPAYIIDLQKK
jgi:hypothetical protein